ISRRMSHTAIDIGVPVATGPTGAARSTWRSTDRGWRCGARVAAAVRLCRLREAVTQGVHHESDPIPHPELLKDVREVGLHGPLADRERRADFLILVPRCHQPDDLELAFGKPVLVSPTAAAAHGS